MSGIIALAIGTEASLHPGETTTAQAAVATGLGLTLFLLSTAVALWRAHGCVLWNRLVIWVLALAGVEVASRSSTSLVLGVAAAGLGVIVVYEQAVVWRRVGA